MPIARPAFAVIALLFAIPVTAQPEPSPLAAFIKEDAPVLVLEHVNLIDGTGTAPQRDMRIDIVHGKIVAVAQADRHDAYPPNAKVLDLSGPQSPWSSLHRMQHRVARNSWKGGQSFPCSASDSEGGLACAGEIVALARIAPVFPQIDTVRLAH